MISWCFFTMTWDCHPPSPGAWSNTYLWVVELTWEIPRKIADGSWDAMQIVAVPMEDICIMVGLVVSVMLSWWLLCRELQDKMVVLNQQCWIRWLKMPGKQTIGAGGLQEEWDARHLSAFLGTSSWLCRLLLWLLLSIWCPFHPHTASLCMKGSGSALRVLGWPEGMWEHCPDIPVAASRTPLQGIEVLRWCFMVSVCGELLSPGRCVGEFALLLAASLVYLILNLVLVHLKWDWVSLGISVCPLYP